MATPNTPHPVDLYHGQIIARTMVRDSSGINDSLRALHDELTRSAALPLKDLVKDPAVLEDDENK